MSADISRKTFRKKRHFRRVIEQQGRGHLDSEFNEQIDILHYYHDSSLRDIIGLSGAPLTHPGFKISFLNTKEPVFYIGKGHYYVDGLLCENHKTRIVTNQPDLPYKDDEDQVSIPTNEEKHLVYLDAWERDITCVDDESILEPALGGISNTIRSKLVWQVKVLEIEDSFSDLNPVHLREYLLSKCEVKGCGLQAQVNIGPQENEECEIPPFSGYSGLENLLYRVEVHSVDDEKITYKWSRYNKSGVAKFKFLSQSAGSGIVPIFLDEGSKAVFKDAKYVELTNNRVELHGLPGYLLRIDINQIDDNELYFDNSSEYQSAKSLGDDQLKCIAWNGRGDAKFDDGYIDLECGIQIKFHGDKTNFKTGDYWLIPARTTGDNILWPTIFTEQNEIVPCKLPPLGIKHHYSTLAVIKKTETNWKPVKDLRSLFSNLSSYPRLFYVGGDGQTGLPGKALTFPLRARVATPIGEKVKVRFSVLQGEGSVNPSDCIVTDGYVECIWSLGQTDKYQQVSACLLDESDQPISNSYIYYYAYARVSILTRFFMKLLYRR